MNTKLNGHESLERDLTSLEEAEMISAIELSFGDILDALMINWRGDDNMKGTPKRVAKMFVKEIFSGRYTSPPSVTVFDNQTGYDEPYIVGPIRFESTCSHHLMPIVGRAWVGIEAGGSLAGLSKFVRLVRWVMRRPQIQEGATEQLANVLMEKTQAAGIAVKVDALHGCMVCRGVHDDRSTMKTFSYKGTFLADKVKRDGFTSEVRNAGN